MGTSAPETETQETQEAENTVLKDAIKEAHANEDPIVLPEEKEPEETDDLPEPHEESEIDDIDFQVEHREWPVKGRVMVQRGRGGPVEEVDFEKTYVQKPLSYLSMMQFTGMIGEKIVQVMSGPDGLTIDGVLSDPGVLQSAGALFAREDFSNVDAFVKGFARVASYVPDLLEDAQCIWLQIPLHERAAVKQIWARSPGDGGLSVAEGQEMLELFLTQNYGELEDFFIVRLPRLLALTRKLRARRAKSPRSKR